MKILITSGGTTEKIDAVRGITNHSTGTLGKYIAERFLDDYEVTLVTTKSAVKPESHPHLTLHIIDNVDSLMNNLEPLVKTHDVLIHSMAVSDYTPVYMTDLTELKQAQKISDLLKKSNTETKISSQADYQVLFLKKTPKVISKVKIWNPAIKLIGFKLLVDVSRDELLTVAKKSLETNGADYILANDLTAISVKQHMAYLVGPNSLDQAKTKPEIADLIYQKVITYDKN